MEDLVLAHELVMWLFLDLRFGKEGLFLVARDDELLAEVILCSS